MQAYKATQNSDIPARLIKESPDIFAYFILENLNYSISQSVFPSALKLANTTPVKKKIQKVKKIITGTSVFYQIFLKIYERFLFKQISEYFKQFLYIFHCAFTVDNKKVFGALLTDFSKIFDCLSHDLLIAKLNEMHTDLVWQL